MKRFALPFYLFLTTVALLIGCKDERQVLENTLTYVPSGALSVAAVDVKKLLQKIDFEAVGKLEMFQNMSGMRDSSNHKKDENLWSSLKTLLASGIDLEQKLLIVQELPGDTTQKFNGFALLNLSDADNFEKLLRKQEKLEIMKGEGDIRFAVVDGKPRIGWNEAVAVLPFAPFPTDKIARILNQQFAEKTAVTPEMVAAVESPHDLTGWFSTHSLAQHPLFGTPLLMMDISPEVLKGNYLFTQIDFEEKKIAGKMNFQVRNEFGEEFIGRFFKEKITTNYSVLLPGDSLDYFAVLTLDPEGIVAFLENRPQAKGYMEFALKEYSSSPAQLASAFHGDVFVAAVTEKPYLVCRIKSQMEVEKWLELSLKTKTLRQIEPAVFEIKGKEKRRFCTVANGFLSWSEDEELAKNLTKFNLESKVITQDFENQCFSIFVSSNWMGAVNQAFLEKMEFKANAAGAIFSIKMKDQSRNSLHVLLEWINAHFKKQ